MSDFDRDATVTRWTQPAARADKGVIDQGLRAYMLRIYNYMVLGLAITGVAALGVYMLAVTDTLANAEYVLRGTRVFPATAGMALQSRDILLTGFGHAVFVSPLKWGIMLAPLALVFGLSFLAERMRPAMAQMLFWLFSALVGVSLATIFLVFTHTSIVRVFFITAASFGALSLWGYTTQRDLSGIGSFLIMGLFGIIIASLVNIFMASSAIQFAISVGGVLVFAGLTAYDTQRLKTEYVYSGMEGEVAERSAIMGALSLYLNFLNLFTFLLQLMGQRDQ